MKEQFICEEIFDSIKGVYQNVVMLIEMFWRNKLSFEELRYYPRRPTKYTLQINEFRIFTILYKCPIIF